jgi:hypothetical protein
MHVVPNRTPYFGVVIQDELEKWWGAGGAGEVLSDIDGENLTGYPLGFINLQQGVARNWRAPLTYVQYILTYDLNGDADFFGPAGLFQNVAGKARFALREGVPSLVAETEPWRLHPGDFPYGGFVDDAGASGLPDGKKDHMAVGKIVAKVRELRAAAAAPYVEAVGNRIKGAPNEPQVKYMLPGTDWTITESGVLVHGQPHLRSRFDKPAGYPRLAGTDDAPSATF